MFTCLAMPYVDELCFFKYLLPITLVLLILVLPIYVILVCRKNMEKILHFSVKILCTVYSFSDQYCVVRNGAETPQRPKIGREWPLTSNLTTIGCFTLKRFF